MSPHDKFVAIGRVVKPHGVRGELCVENHASSADLYAVGRVLWLRLPQKSGQGLTVVGVRPHQGRLLVTLEGVADRDRAESLRGAEVLAEAGDLPPPGEDEIYLHEIEGFAVVLENGDPVGVLEGFLDLPGQDVWSIRSPQGKEVLLPANDETVAGIDVEARTVTVTPPPGLLDLYR
ncbi:ribosome maturation factor RimM [Fundidesulfovibrio butyratiphilus]